MLEETDIDALFAFCHMFKNPIVMGSLDGFYFPSADGEDSGEDIQIFRLPYFPQSDVRDAGKKSLAAVTESNQ